MIRKKISRWWFRTTAYWRVSLLVTALLMAPGAGAEMELAPYAGFRMGSDFDIRNSSDDSTSSLEFKDSESFGLVMNFDLGQAGKQAELYFARQDTTASSRDTLLTDDSYSVNVTIYQLQFGGLYFPGGKTTGGFVSGVAGVTRLDPKPSDLDDHHRASISLGGGYKLALTSQVLARVDLRGIYTVLDSGGAVFCSGGCRARFDTNGYGQVEASAGLVLRF